MASTGAKRLYTELNVFKNLSEDPNSGVKFIVDQSPFHRDNTPAVSAPSGGAASDQGQFSVVIGRILPNSIPFNESGFKIEIKVPDEFPFKAPQVRMLTRIYHPNIGEEGLICIPMLRPTATWKPATTLVDIVKAVVEVIDKPNIDEAAHPKMASEYMTNRVEFDRKAREMIRENYEPRT